MAVRLNALLHGQTALALERRLHAHGVPLVVLPMGVQMTNAEARATG